VIARIMPEGLKLLSRLDEPVQEAPTMTAPECASSAASSGASEARWKVWPLIRITPTRYLGCPGAAETAKIETTRNAFAYVFADSGTFRDGLGTPRGSDRPSREALCSSPVYTSICVKAALLGRVEEGDSGSRRRNLSCALAELYQQMVICQS